MEEEFIWPSDAARAESDDLNRTCEYAEHLEKRLNALIKEQHEMALLMGTCHVYPWCCEEEKN